MMRQWGVDHDERDCGDGVEHWTMARWSGTSDDGDDDRAGGLPISTRMSSIAMMMRMCQFIGQRRGVNEGHNNKKKGERGHQQPASPLQST